MKPHPPAFDSLFSAGRWILLLAVPFLTGCAAPGLLYTNMVLPYTTNFDNTPVATNRCVLDTHQIREPVSAYGLAAEWTTGDFAALAREAGIATPRYADIRRFSVLYGLYRRNSIIVYGD